MRKVKNIVLSGGLLIAIIGTVGFTSHYSPNKVDDFYSVMVNQNQSINLFVTHGHCSTPFTGKVEGLEIKAISRQDGGNPLEDMKLSFIIDPSSFFVCAGNEFTEQAKSKGLFFDEHHNKISFRTTNVYVMGIDWYQVNGKMTIKGVEKDVKFFASGIRNPKEPMPSYLILEGQLNLFDWGIDYDKIVYGSSTITSTQWMHLNMKIQI